ncbi:hypothetical protein Celaphus_00019185 [Cervus elaphus hippelaphus]|uniref:FERM N-terminal domain-containing protein n=1 Tax=Cervus elaphus hippelaphus TaxID=46360 RepID=A0A212C7F2_CEREH|nr:hypothetical protein Celaphus_00019185 [Cervus elaphus hippelaphus]
MAGKTQRVQATGRELFQQVCDRTGIREAHFFGLSVVRSKQGSSGDPGTPAPSQEVNRTPQLLYDFPWPQVEKLAFLDKKEDQPTIILGLTLRGVQVFQVTAGAAPSAPALPPALALTLPWLTVDAADPAVLQEVNRTPQLLYDFPWPQVEKLAFLQPLAVVQVTLVSLRAPSAEATLHQTEAPLLTQKPLELRSYFCAPSGPCGDAENCAQ